MAKMLVNCDEFDIQFNNIIWIWLLLFQLRETTTKEWSEDIIVFKICQLEANITVHCERKLPTMAMASDINMKNEKGGTFLCEMCGLTESYNYYGCKPPFHKDITFLENCYIMKDPFQSAGTKSFLLLGSECVACKRVVCQASSCSIFYTKRFCLDCARTCIEEFPPEMQKRIGK